MMQWSIRVTAILFLCNCCYHDFRHKEPSAIDVWSVQTSCQAAEVGVWKDLKDAEAAESFFRHYSDLNECLLVLGWQGSTRFSYISPTTANRPNYIGSSSRDLIEVGIGYGGLSFWFLGGEPKFKTFARSVRTDGVVTAVFSLQNGRCFKKPDPSEGISGKKTEVGLIECKSSPALNSWITFLSESGFLAR